MAPFVYKGVVAPTMRVGTRSDNVMAMTDTETNEVKRLTDTIEGWLTDKEGKYLYNLAKSCAGRGVIVENWLLERKIDDMAWHWLEERRKD